MQKKVVVIGASGHARVIADVIKSSNDELIGFLDDNKEVQGKTIFDDKQVLGTTNEQDINIYNDCYFIIGIGSNKVRKTIAEKYPNLKKIDINCDFPEFDVFLLHRPNLLSTTTQEFIRFINKIKI